MHIVNNFCLEGKLMIPPLGLSFLPATQFLSASDPGRVFWTDMAPFTGALPCLYVASWTTEKHGQCKLYCNMCEGPSLGLHGHLQEQRCKSWKCACKNVFFTMYSLLVISNIRGDKNKSGLLWLNAKFTAKMEQTKTYHIPNQWKFYEDFAELYKF